jgi:hypothetical protein
VRVGYLANNFGFIQNPQAMTPAQLVGHAGLNLGNLAFWYSARRLFADPATLVHWHSDAAPLREAIDVFVIPAANFLNPAFDLTQLADLVEALDKPVLIWGLGAQADSEEAVPRLKPGTERFLAAVASRTAAIFARGEYSARVCRHYGATNVEVIGCPSLFMNPEPHLGRRVEARLGRAPDALYVAGATYTKAAAAVDAALFHAAARREHATYVVQDPAALVAFVANAGLEDAFQPKIAQVLEILRRDNSAEWAAEHLQRIGAYFTGIPDWMEAASTHDYAISLRIHGAVIALMAGVPSLVVGHDARVRELATTMGLPLIGVAEMEANLPRLDAFCRDLRFDGERFDANRARIAARYVTQLTVAGLQPVPFLTELASAALQTSV